MFYGISSIYIGAQVWYTYNTNQTYKAGICMRVELCAFADEAADAFTEQIAALDRNGIRKIELRGVNGCNVRDLSDTAARAAAAELRAAGISVWSIGSPLGKSDIGADFAPAQALLRRLLTLCEIFSCDKIRVFSFFTRDPAADKAEVLRRLRILTETAAAYGVRLYHENEKDIFGDTAARVEQLLDAVPLLCSVYDPANYVQVGETQENMQRAAARAGYYHIKDALRANGATVPAGEGDGEIGALLASLQGDAVLTLEPHLAVFSGYAAIDAHEMKNTRTFASNGAAIDFAARALKALLRQNGFTEKGGAWIR